MQVGRYKKEGNNRSYIGGEISGRPGAIISIIISIPIILIGVALLIFTTFSYYENYRKKDFIDVNAKVTKLWFDDETVSSDNSNESTEIDRYQLTYIVDNKSYTNDEYTGAFDPLKLGDTVLIRYNPNDPSDITWGDRKTNILLPILTVFVLFAGLKVLTFNIKKFKNPNAVVGNSGISIASGDTGPGLSYGGRRRNSYLYDADEPDREVNHIDL